MLGEVRMFTGQFPPTGWAFCNGDKLKKVDHPGLSAVINGAFGQSDDEFALPDFRKRFPTHPDDEDIQIGKQGGSDQVKINSANLPSLKVNIPASNNDGNQTTPGGNVMARAEGPDVFVYTDTEPTVEMAAGKVADTKGESLLIIPPFLAIQFIICIEGDFPYATGGQGC